MKSKYLKWLKSKLKHSKYSIFGGEYAKLATLAILQYIFFLQTCSPVYLSIILNRVNIVTSRQDLKGLKKTSLFYFLKLIF